MTPHAHAAHATHAAHADAARPAEPTPGEPGQPGSLGATLRARGLRSTPQREQVLATVRDLGHATPEQIGQHLPDVDAATVYRTLELLEELGLIKHAHLGHGAPSYRPSEDDHVHVVCHSCEQVIDAPHDLVDALEARLLAERGFAIDRSHFTVFGTCAQCRDKAHPEAAR